MKVKSAGNHLLQHLRSDFLFYLLTFDFIGGTRRKIVDGGPRPPSSAFQPGWQPPGFELPIARNSAPLRSCCYLSWKRQRRRKCFPLCVKLCDTRGRFVRGREKLCRGIEKSRLLRLLMWLKLFSLRIWQLVRHLGICSLPCAEL